MAIFIQREKAFERNVWRLHTAFAGLCNDVLGQEGVNV